MRTDIDRSSCHFRREVIVHVAPPVNFFTLTIALAASTGAVWCANQEATVTLDGANMTLDAPAYYVDGRFVMCPAVSYLEGLGAKVWWDATAQTITASRSNHGLVFGIGHTTVTVDGEVKQLGTPPRMIGGRPYIPMRLPAEHFGFKVAWNKASLTASLSSPSNATLKVIKISDRLIKNPSLCNIGSGYLLVSGHTSAGNSNDKLVYAVGSDRGKTWKITEQALPTGADASWPGRAVFISDFDGFYFGALKIPPARAAQMPMWFTNLTSWNDAMVSPAPTGVGYRVFHDMVVTGDSRNVLYAAGDEGPSESSCVSKLWRSTDMGLTWQALTVPGVTTSTWARIHDAAPDGTVWGEGQDHLIRFDPDGTSTAIEKWYNCQIVESVNSPTGSDVFAVWAYGEPTTMKPSQRVLSHSSDGGASWKHEWNFTWWVGSMDWADGSFGMFVHKDGIADTDPYRLYYTKDCCGHWFRDNLDGWEPIPGGLTVINSTEAYIIARKQGSGDRRLYCLCWTLGW